MKRKIFKVAAAAVMALVCLTGCSAGFSSRSAIQAAKKCKMFELPDLDRYYIGDRGRSDNERFYYISKDKDEAAYMFGSVLPSFTNGGGVNEVAIFEEYKQETEEHRMLQTHIDFLTFEDEEKAQKEYDRVSQGINSYSSMTADEKSGVTYKIGYEGFENRGYEETGSVPEMFFGIYINGNKLVFIHGNYDKACKNDVVETFCKNLGIVSPYTLKET